MIESETPEARFLRNAWYMAGWSSEIGDQLLRRRLLGHAILLYRLEHGRVAALEDRCPLRFLPLSKGERHGDRIAPLTISGKLLAPRQSQLPKAMNLCAR